MPYFCFNTADANRALHSFPTRRSSDLEAELEAGFEAASSEARKAFGADEIYLEKYLEIDFIRPERDRKSTRLNSSHTVISYAVFCLKKKTNTHVPSEAMNAVSVILCQG